MNIGKYFEDTLPKPIYHQLCKIQRIGESLARCFIKVTARPSFTRLRVFRQTSKDQNRKYVTKI